jgi:hypothetical protein
LTVSNTFNWIGGTMTSNCGGVGTTTLTGTAALLIFQYGLQTASDRQININLFASATIFENAQLTLTGGVTITNAGTFTALDDTAIVGTSSDAFNNTGAFVCGSITASASIALTVPFNNSGQVTIQAGTMSVQAGTSTGN